MTDVNSDVPHFFISRAGADAELAGLVGSILETSGFRVVLQQWDFANRNFMERMDAALSSGARVVCLLSASYLTSDYCAAEWMHTLHGDPLNKKSKLIILRVNECHPQGLLRTIGYWDLVHTRSNQDLFAKAIRTAIADPQQQRSLNPGANLWRPPLPLLHDTLRAKSDFMGRSLELYEVDSSLWSRGLVILSGMGGVGKSTMAREYAWRAQDGYCGVWWFNAQSDPASQSWPHIEAGLLQLGEHFMPGISQSRDGTSAAREVIRFLSASGFTKPWLFIYDNIDNSRVVDVWGGGDCIHIIGTSRLAGWPSDAHVRVGVWPEADAMTYLTKFSGRSDIDEVSTALLVHFLGSLPLAISHATSFLRRRATVSVQDYLSELNSHMQKAPRDSDYPTPVYATLVSSLAAIKEEAAEAIPIIYLASYLPSDEIPIELIVDAHRILADLQLLHQVNRRQILVALGVLNEYSLIGVVERENSLKVHRIVQMAIQHHADADAEAWRFAVSRLLHEHLLSTQLWAAGNRQSAAMTALMAARNDVGSGWTKLDVDTTNRLNHAAVRLSQAGRIKEAKDVARSAVENAKAMNQISMLRSPETVILLSQSLMNFAVICRHDNDLPAAITACEESLEVARHGKASYAELFEYQYISSLQTLASLQDETGNSASAIAMAEEVCRYFENMLDISERPGMLADYARSLNNIGNFYASVEIYDKALAAARKAVEIVDRLAKDEPGTYEPFLARYLWNLGSREGGAGDVEAAFACQDRSLEIQQDLCEVDFRAFGGEYVSCLLTRARMMKMAGEGDVATEIIIEIGRLLDSAPVEMIGIDRLKASLEQLKKDPAMRPELED